MGKTALARAIAVAGSQSALAELIGRTQQAISHWVVKETNVPAEDAVKIETALKGKVKRSELRPDLWPPKEGARA